MGLSTNLWKGYDQGKFTLSTKFFFSLKQRKLLFIAVFGKKWHYVTLSIGQMYGLADVGNIGCAIMFKICDNIRNMRWNIMYVKWSEIDCIL